MSDASLIALFSVGMASTLTVLFLAFRRTFRLEQGTHIDAENAAPP